MYLVRTRKKVLNESVGEIHGNSALRNTLKLIGPAAEASTTQGTKRQKSSLLRYWAMFCAAYDVDIVAFGRDPKEKGKEAKE